jgi:predicted  nucleic acid-binding Zn-ribbon protein
MDKTTMKKEIDSLKGVIYRLNKKCKDIEALIPQAERVVEQLKPLEQSTDSRERMKYLSASLDLASLKNDLANAKALITLKQDQLDMIGKRFGDEQPASAPEME